MKYSIVTFGCRVNQADSFVIEEELRRRGGVDVPPEDADVVRPARGITAGDHHANVRVAPGDSSDGLSRTLVRRGGHRTRIDDDKIRFFGRHIDTTAASKLLFDHEGVGLVDPAPERDDRVLHKAFRPMSRRNCMPSN